jgi:hypothetical protein
MIQKFSLLVSLFLLCSWLVGAEAPSVLYLTWVGDPTSTMVLNWQTPKKETSSFVEYREAGSEKWLQGEGTVRRLSDSSSCSHKLELVGLKANCVYEFRVCPRETVYRFRTLPKTLERPVRFAVGGDAYYYVSLFRKMNRAIASYSPDFVVVGGDLAYTEGKRASFQGEKWKTKRWRAFFKEWKEQMVTQEGLLIPMVVVVGNHDVCGRAKAVQPFYECFPFPEEKVPFRALDFGNYLSLILLDTGHSFPIAGAQVEWLKQTLAVREAFPFKMAVYHVGAFPSVYPYDGRAPELIRKEWVPLFERYRLQFAFENHNHAYKRTHPIKEGKIDPNGVVYMGDGSWGVSPRKPREGLWYAEKVAQENCFSLITLQKESAVIRAYNGENALLDTFSTPSKLLSHHEGHLLSFY